MSTGRDECYRGAMKAQMIVCFVVGAALLTACKSKDQKASSARAEKAIEQASEGAKADPPTFDITVQRVVLAAELAPNATYAKNGLGKKAGDGNTFACAEYDVKNTGAKPANPGLPKLADAAGKLYDVSTDAAGSLPEDWKSTFHAGPIAPAAAQHVYSCYVVPTAVGGGALKLKFDEPGWGEVGPFAKTVDLPAATTL